MKEKTTKQLLLSSKAPKEVLLLVAKPCGMVFNDAWDLSEIEECSVGKFKRTKDPVKVKIQCFCREQEKIVKTGLSSFDMSVYNAICSLYKANHPVFTDRSVYFVMTGGTLNSEKMRTFIKNSIRRMQTTLCSLNWEAQAKMYGLYKENDGVSVYHFREKNLLYLETEGIFFKGNGKDKKSVDRDVSTYKFIKKPVLYEYSDAINQVYSIDNKVVHIPIRYSKEVIIIRDYLVKRIEMIKGSNSITSNKINFSSVYEDCALRGDKYSLKRKRDVIDKMLSYWKDIGYIKDFSYVKNKNTFFQISVNV